MRLRNILRYIRPREYFCRASKTWDKLRRKVIEKNIDIGDLDRPFLVGIEKDGFLAVALKTIDECELIGCNCEKAAMMREIKKLLEQVDNDPHHIPHHINGYYADLERLLDL